MVYVHTILRDVAGLFKVGRLVAYGLSKWNEMIKPRYNLARLIGAAEPPPSFGVVHIGHE